MQDGDGDHVESYAEHVHHRRPNLRLDLAGSQRADAGVVQAHADVECTEREQSEPVTHEKDGQRQCESGRRVHVTRCVMHLVMVRSVSE